MRPNSQNANLQSGFVTLSNNPRPISGGFLKLHSFAKINVFLDVIGKRQDGYHNIVSVMQTIDLHDDLVFFKTNSTESFTLTSDSKEIPNDESNLITRAAMLMIKEYNINQPFEINLTKRIPAGAGLGGGSSNCAAALHGINQLFNLNITKPELESIGVALGADVPFCINGGSCMAEGIGEKLTALGSHPDCFIIIVFPGLHVPTKTIFSELGSNNWNKGRGKLQNILRGFLFNDLTSVAFSLYNIFTDITGAKHLEIKELIQKLKKHGALGASMTGTGSAVFGYFNDIQTAKKAIDNLNPMDKVFIAKPVNREMIL